MAAFGQTFDSNAWLMRSRTPLVYPKIDVGATTSAGSTVWVNWWLITWVFLPPPFFDQGRLIRSTWICNPSHSYPRAWPFIQHTAPDAGQTVWNNWWFNTPFVPANKYGLFMGVGPYSYTGQTAGLGAQRNLSIVAATGIYTYQGAPSQSDFGISNDFTPYSYNGQPLFSIDYVLNAETGIYHYAGGPFGLRFIYPAKGVILTTSTRAVFGPKRVSNVLAPPFDFTGQLQPADVISSPTVTVSVWSGVDANPQALYSGLFLISGDIVYPTLVDGVGGVIYQITVRVNATVSGVLSQSAFLTVLPDSL